MIKEFRGGGKKNCVIYDCNKNPALKGGAKQRIVGAFLLFETDFVARNHDTTIGKSPVLGEGVRVVVPACFDQFGEDTFSTGIRFGTHAQDFT